MGLWMEAIVIEIKMDSGDILEAKLRELGIIRH